MRVCRDPRLLRPALTSDAELVALAVAQAAIGISSDRQFLGLADRVLPRWFPHLPEQSQYNRRVGGPGFGHPPCGNYDEVMFDSRAASSESWTERLLALLMIATALAAIDQWVKLTVPTPAWALHHRSDVWFFGSCLLLVAVLPLTRLPSRAVAVAAGIFSGGVLGNLLSASSGGLYVPNPIIIMHSVGGVAFNPADTFILAGNLALVTTLVCICLRHREERSRWRSGRQRA